MRTALIIGGTGQIGIAITNRLVSMGWSVTTSTRSLPSARISAQHDIVNASSYEDLFKSITTPIDLLVSCVAFDKEDAAQLLCVDKDIGRIVAISSVSVYRDEKGRTLDESRESGFPVFDGPMTENTLTVAPGPQTYSTRKMAMERTLLEQDEVPVTILRPCAVHGPHSKHAREWWFVKRLLDGRTKIPLAYGGESQFQTTSVEAIADAVVLAADSKLPVIANVCDADSPTVKQIGQAIMKILGIEAELVGLNDSAYPAIAGATPWSVPGPYIASGVVPGKPSYAETVHSTVSWLKKEVNTNNWQTVLPQLAGYPYDHFDYSVDDTAV